MAKRQRDYKAEYRRRNEVAKSKGYKGYSDRRKINRMAKRDPALYLVETLLGRLGKPIETLEELFDLQGILDWDYWKIRYSELSEPG